MKKVTKKHVDLVLEEQLTIVNVHAQHIAWRDVAKAKDNVMVDASAVKSIDSAALQLLIVLKRSVEAADRSFQFDSVSDEMRQVAKLVDLDKELGI